MRIAFLVEPQYGEVHFGVRNFYQTIKMALSNNNICDYITYSSNRQGDMWYRVIEDLRPQSIQTQKITITKYEINSFNLDRFNAKTCAYSYSKKCYYFQCLGTSLEREKYDICIITNPWLLKEGLNINAGIVIGIVHDFVANIYSMTNGNSPVEWGNMHHVGYKYYIDHCDYIISNSQETMRQCFMYYPEMKNKKLLFFQPFMPYQYSSVDYRECGEKENGIVLAAPFDIRKGLKRIPEIINSISKEGVSQIYIFGMPRCKEKDFNMFFKELKAAVDVVFYPTISYEDLIALYKKCKLLIFPSNEEGLGIPIIEAQVCGCRVATTNEKPMNELVLNGGYLFHYDLLRDQERLLFMLKEDFDYMSLAKEAQQRFSLDSIVDLIETLPYGTKKTD